MRRLGLSDRNYFEIRFAGQRYEQPVYLGLAPPRGTLLRGVPITPEAIARGIERLRGGT